MLKKMQKIYSLWNSITFSIDRTAFAFGLCCSTSSGMGSNWKEQKTIEKLSMKCFSLSKGKQNKTMALHTFTVSVLNHQKSHLWDHLWHLCWNKTALTWQWSYAYWEHRLSALNVSQRFFWWAEYGEIGLSINVTDSCSEASLQNFTWTNASPSRFKGSFLIVAHGPRLSQSKRWGASLSCWHNRK